MNIPSTFQLDGWAIVEIMGHESTAGYIQRDGKLIFVAVPEAPGIEAEEMGEYLYDPVEAQPPQNLVLGEGAIYRITLTTQENVQEYLRRSQICRRNRTWKGRLIGAQPGDDEDYDDRDRFEDPEDDE